MWTDKIGALTVLKKGGAIIAPIRSPFRKVLYCIVLFCVLFTNRRFFHWNDNSYWGFQHFYKVFSDFGSRLLKPFVFDFWQNFEFFLAIFFSKLYQKSKNQKFKNRKFSGDRIQLQNPKTVYKNIEYPRSYHFFNTNNYLFL